MCPRCLKSASDVWVPQIGTQHPAYLCPFPTTVFVADKELEVLPGLSKDIDVCSDCALNLNVNINAFINTSENKKHPLTFLIQKYGSTLQSNVKSTIKCIIEENKSLASMSEELNRDTAKKNTPRIVAAGIALFYCGETLVPWYLSHGGHI